MPKKNTKIEIADTRNKVSPGGKTVIISSPKIGDYDIGDLRQALKSAKDTLYPNRAKLYDIYEYISDDPHLSSVIEKRKLSVSGCKIEFLRNGQQDPRINELIAAPWFTRFTNEALDTQGFGFSLFQFYREGRWINYDLIPRKHVDPHHRIIRTHQTDTSGYSFNEFNNLLSVGTTSDLGKLKKVAKAVIYKNNALGDFVQFAEQYGQPIKEGIYDGYDDTAREKMVEDLYNMGGSAVFVHPKGTEITLHDSASKGASATLFNALLEFCNKEISKAYLGNTLTTDAGDKGTQALGTVHQGAEDKLVVSDKKFILDILNYDFIDILDLLGYNVKGGKFVFVEESNSDLTKRFAIDSGLKNMGLPIDDDYLYETYNIPKPSNYDTLKSKETPYADKTIFEPKITDVDSKEQKDKSFRNALKSFFADALKKRALDW